jgi:hypothetical protein
MAKVNHDGRSFRGERTLIEGARQVGDEGDVGGFNRTGQFQEANRLAHDQDERQRDEHDKPDDEGVLQEPLMGPSALDSEGAEEEARAVSEEPPEAVLVRQHRAIGLR